MRIFQLIIEKYSTMLLVILQFSFKDFLIGENGLNFLPEVALRCIVMYIILFTSLKVTGKRGIKQLSVFELVIILGLGSAAGDPMFYKEVGIIPVALVFVIIIILYRLTTAAVAISPKLESILEGKPIYVIENGFFCIDNIKKNQLGEDEFLAELRREKVTQLGQVKTAILETDGELSVFFEEDSKVTYGLPTLPKLLNIKVNSLSDGTHYSCKFCGNTILPEKQNTVNCDRYGKIDWVESKNEKRIT